ncbi:MAG TPA: acyl-CoA desaturase [Polyangiaceae bacterium]
MDTAREPLRGRKLYFNLGSIPFWAVHLGAVAGVVVLGFSWSGLFLAIASYYVRMFFLTAGYHRYFSHRSFSTSRAFQFVLALMGQTCAQMGALWWAANHRAHHRYSDGVEDVHSPVQRGFWWSQIGWFMDGQHEGTDYARIPDLAKYPELRFLNNRNVGLLPPTIMGVILYAVGGMHAMIWGLFVSTVLLWHGTFTINSLAHMWGTRRYTTRDDSRNNLFLALITMGEGWHNNHHHFQASARQGFFWWEIDLTFYVLRGLQAVGIIWDLREPPQHVVFPKKKQELSSDDMPAAVFPHASSRPDRAA